MKAWVVESEGVPVAALVGSANLTKNGLEANVEIMVEATGDDLIRTWGEVRGLHEKGWDCAERLAGYMDISVDHGQGEIEETEDITELAGEEADVRHCRVSHYSTKMKPAAHRVVATSRADR